MYYIKIVDTETERIWTEEFTSYFHFKKRVNKLKYSERLRILSRSNL